VKAHRRRISTESIELALEQVVRARTSGTKASIKPVFVIKVLKELIDRRREERLIFDEVKELFDDDELVTVAEESDVEIVVREVESLSELGVSSWESSDEKNEKRVEKEVDGVPLDDSDVTHSVRRRPVLRPSRRRTVGMHESCWQDGTAARHAVIFTLVVIIALTLFPILMVL